MGPGHPYAHLKGPDSRVSRQRKALTTAYPVSIMVYCVTACMFRRVSLTWKQQRKFSERQATSGTSSARASIGASATYSTAAGAES